MHHSIFSCVVVYQKQAEAVICSEPLCYIMMDRPVPLCSLLYYRGMNQTHDVS